MAGTIWDQKRIGIISEVDTSSAMVAVESRLSGLSIQLNGKVYPIGQIGTYVLVPVGKQVLLGMVSEFRRRILGENGSSTAHCDMRITLVGSIRSGMFERGVSSFPTAEAPVYLLEDRDLAVAFSVFQRFGFSLGRLSLFDQERAYVDPNRFSGNTLPLSAQVVPASHVP